MIKDKKIKDKKIKDKITPELRSRFIEDIKRSKESGKEIGFFLCENKEEKLIPSKSCEGTECDIHLGDPKKGCPTETTTYGEFHTHPYLYSIRQELRKERYPKAEFILKERYPKAEFIFDEELKNIISKNIRDAHERIGVKGITINTPSYTDIMRALLSKFINVTNGTVCTSTDIETNKVECWTIKDVRKDKLKNLTIIGISELEKAKPKGSQLIKKWIDDVSDRETIEL